MARTRLVNGRREELLDGVMTIIASRGFADVRMGELATELRCSVSSLYKIAPSKDSLVMLAISRWGERALAEIENEAAQQADRAKRARTYFLAASRQLRGLSSAFRIDVDRYESTRLLWRKAVADPFFERFVELLEAAIAAGEVRPVHSQLVGRMLTQLGFITRDEQTLAAMGLTAERALVEIDSIIWDGIGLRSSAEG